MISCARLVSSPCMCISPDEDGLFVYGGFVCASVYAWCFNGGPLAFCLVHIDPCAVEAAEVVDDGHHELEGVVCLQPEALEALYGVGGRVCLGEGVAGERLDLAPHLLCYLFGVALLAAVGKEASQ